VFGYWGLGWLTRRSFPASPLSAEIYARLPFHARRRRPALRVVSRIDRPVLLGLFRQYILIPIDLDLPASADKLRLGLLHELAHAERRDPWFSLAGGLSQAFWFFLPPLWWIRAQMRLDQEFLADRHASLGFGPGPAYASSLLDLAHPAGARSPAPVPKRSNTAVGGSALFQRILMLVQCPFPVESRPPRWWSWSVASLALLATLSASRLSLQVSAPATRCADSPKRDAKFTQTFRMPRLAWPSDMRNRPEQPTFVELPLDLPDRFQLELEIWGDLDAISHIRVIGHRLNPPLPAANPEIIVEEWHRIKVRRDHGEVAISIDGRSTPVRENESTTPKLALESPASQPARIQNLVLRW
jgi:hypothetical protein